MIDKRFQKLKAVLADEKKVVNEIDRLYTNMEGLSAGEKTLVRSQLDVIENKLKETHTNLKTAFSEILFSKPLEITKRKIKGKDTPEVPKPTKGIERFDELKSEGGKLFTMKEISPNKLEKETVVD